MLSNSYATVLNYINVKKYNMKIKVNTYKKCINNDKEIFKMLNVCYKKEVDFENFVLS